MKTVVLPINVMRCLCVKAVILTNAAGGLNPDLNVGDVVCITDHFAVRCTVGLA
jgi:purine-nucleoside phosphorylase